MTLFIFGLNYPLNNRKEIVRIWLKNKTHERLKHCKYFLRLIKTYKVNYALGNILRNIPLAKVTKNKTRCHAWGHISQKMWLVFHIFPKLEELQV